MTHAIESFTMLDYKVIVALLKFTFKFQCKLLDSMYILLFVPTVVALICIDT